MARNLRSFQAVSFLKFKKNLGLNSEADVGPSHTSRMEPFAKIVKGIGRRIGIVYEQGVRLEKRV